MFGLDGGSGFNIQGPTFALPPSGAIRGSHYFRGFRGLVRNLGGDYRKILERHDIDPLATADPDHPVDCRSGAALLEYCRGMLNDELFGLHLADCQDANVYGMLTAYARSAPTVGQSIRCFVDYLPILHCPGSHPEFVEGSDTAEYRWRPHADFGRDHQANSHGLLLAVRFIESLGNADFRPSYVTLMSDVSASDLLTMERLFRGKVFNRASAYSVGIPATMMAQPNNTADRLVFNLLGSYLSRYRKAETGSFVEQVEAYVRIALPSGTCSTDRCAVKLGISSRTLRKRLTEFGIRFSDIVERERIKAAKLGLRTQDLSLDDIANLLGYSEQSSFGRAFRRWTRVTPQAYRDRHAKR